MYADSIIFTKMLFLLGSHTGQNTKDSFDAVILAYDLESKIRYIISDNVLNMRKAFEVTLPGSVINEDLEDEEDSYWFDGEEDVVDDDLIAQPEVGHLRCFAHSLQLVVREGLQHVKLMSSALGQCCSIASTLHSSSKYTYVNYLVTSFTYIALSCLF